MGATPLPGRARQRGGDCIAQPGMAVGDDHVHPGQAAGDQAAQERQPARAVLGGNDVQAENLPLTVGVDAGGDQGVHRHRAAALTHLLSQRVDPHEGIRAAVQRPAAELLHHAVELGGHRRDLRLGQAGDAHRLGQLLHPPRGDAQQVAGGHHRGERPLRSASLVQQEVREVRAGPQPWHGQLDRPGPGVPRTGAVAVTGVDPLAADLAVAGAAQLLDLGVHHPLRELADHRPEQVRARCGEGVFQVLPSSGHNVIDGHFVPFMLI